jgi:hypothetical protein
VFTDKGTFSPSKTTGYPPRADVMRNPPADSASVDTFRAMNPFDAVSQATPAEGVPALVSWAAPFDVDNGDYVLWVEVAQEFDYNTTYSTASYPAPTGISFANYGVPYRGQPSILYRVPITLTTTGTVGSTDTYAGYGDPDGNDGAVRPPDATITTDTPSSGASRFELRSDGGLMYRVRATTRLVDDSIPPAAPTGGDATVTNSSATVTFIAPGDDGTIGRVRGYDVRFRAGEDITDANFDSSTPVSFTLTPVDAGGMQTFTIDKLLPETTYSIGVRAYDECHNTSPVEVVQVTTDARKVGEVNACFIATAAYGSVMANDVEMLRRFRDRILEKTALGELAVETYYTFSPAVAGVVSESELLRATTRDVLAPLVAWVKALR